MSSEITADDNTGADRNTAKKHNQCIDDVGRGTDRRQSFFSDKVADYQTVYRVVKILENITEKERDRKGDQQLCNVSFGHIECFRFFDITHKNPPE